MGFDISVKLIYGYKIVMSKVFELNLISPSIMDEDDWQLISEPETKNEIIDTHVTSETLKMILESGEWNIYILTSTQEDSKPDQSYVFLYNKHENLVSSGAPDYVTGLVDTQYNANNLDEIERRLKEKHPQLSNELNYNIHWVVESSW